MCSDRGQLQQITISRSITYSQRIGNADWSLDMNCRNNSKRYKCLNRCVALGIFLLTMTLYSLTAQLSVAYWDCAEYAATSPTLEVPHPPGAPLFEIVTRIASMIPVVRDIAMRMNLVSGLASALAIMFLYLIGVRVISRWKGAAEDFVTALSVYGASAIGALTLAVSDTFWFNAAESGLFAMSIFFISLIVWLGMVWFDESEKNGNIKYLLLAAYFLGLSGGVHQLCLLAYFPIAVLVYFRKYEFEWKQFIKFGMIALLGFFVIYPGIVKWMVTMLGGGWDFGPLKFTHDVFIQMIPPALLLLAIYGVRKSEKSKKWTLNMVLLSGLFVLMGYSTYALIYVRANANPPINENNPATLQRLVGYLEREQYGRQPALWPRRWSSDPVYQANYAKYSSDLGYFWSYQLSHMYLRYLGFNFIGRAGDIQDAPVVLFGPPGGWHDGEPGFPARYFAIPFLLALFGMWYHFKEDTKLASVFMTMFIVMGFALAVYFNMADPQPRERDYFFVGSFFVFALWVGIGASGIMEILARKVPKLKMKGVVAGITAVVLLVASPVNMFRENLFSHDRHGNYAPFDVSYDILQSCPRNAILFTGGDNDTFPLWYLQETLGIRTDVRVICLSLANTGWYLLQLRDDTPHGAQKVPFTYTDGEIEQIAHMGGVEWQPKTFRLPVPPEVYKEFGFPDTSATDTGYIQYIMDPTIGSGALRGVRVQDLMINSIVTANQWRRPICFGIGVPPHDWIGLGNYFVRQGLVYELSPVPANVPYPDRINAPVMERCVLNEPASYDRHQDYGFMYKGLDKPGIYYDSNTRNMLYTLRDSFVTLASYYQAHNENDKCVATLDSMEAKLPIESIPSDYRELSYIARLYFLAGAMPQFHRFAGIVEKDAIEAIAENPDDVRSAYNPYSVLLGIYDMKSEYGKSIAVLEMLQERFPGSQAIADRIKQLQTMMKERSGSDLRGGSEQK